MNIPRFKPASGLSVSALAAVALAVTISSANAVVIIPTDKLQIFSPMGLVGEVVADEITETGDPNHIYMFMVPGFANPAQVGQATQLNEGGVYSDVFGVISMTIDECMAINPSYQPIDDGLQYFLAFNSGDIASAPSAFGTPTSVLEESTGSPPGTFDATKYLSTTLQTAGYSATFFSDVEATVPEGGTTFGLFGMALLGFGFLRRKGCGQPPEPSVRSV